MPTTRLETLMTPPSTEGRPLLEVADLRLKFGGVTVLNDVSFDVNRGELFAIIGPNGAGKTSIFNCLSAVYRPEVGSIKIDGRELIGMRPAQTVRHGIGRTFQNLGLFPDLDVVENLLLGRHSLMRTGFLTGALWFGRARGEELAHRVVVEEIIELLALTPFRRQPVGTLPYGVQKRIELGRALAMQPKVLLLDEPVAGMNLEESEDMARYIVELRRLLGVAMILVEHDMRLVMDLADRVMVLDFGTPITTGVPDEVTSHPGVLAAYLGGAA